MAAPGSILIANTRIICGKGAVVPVSDICFKCHDINVYQSGLEPRRHGIMTTGDEPGIPVPEPVVEQRPFDHGIFLCELPYPHTFMATEEGMILRGDIEASTIRLLAGRDPRFVAAFFLYRRTMVLKGTTASTARDVHQIAFCQDRWDGYCSNRKTPDAENVFDPAKIP